MRVASQPRHSRFLTPSIPAFHPPSIPAFPPLSIPAKAGIQRAANNLGSARERDTPTLPNN